MASPRRLQRINKTLMKEISYAIMNEVKDPRLTSMVSVLDASMSADMKHVKVIVSLYGESEKNNQKTFDAINSAAGFISSVVSKGLRLRFAPDIHFVRSDSIEKGMEIYYRLKEWADDHHIEEDNH